MEPQPSDPSIAWPDFAVSERLSITLYGEQEWPHQDRGRLRVVKEAKAALSFGVFFRAKEDDFSDAESDALAAVLWVVDAEGTVHEFRNVLRSYELWDLAIRSHFWRPASSLLPEGPHPHVSLRPILKGIRFRTDSRDHRLIGVYEPRSLSSSDDPALRIFRLREYYFGAEFDLVVTRTESNGHGSERLHLCMRFLSKPSSSTLMNLNGDAVSGVHQNLKDLHPLVAELNTRLLLQSIWRPWEQWRSAGWLTSPEDLNVFRRTVHHAQPNLGVLVVAHNADRPV